MASKSPLLSVDTVVNTLSLPFIFWSLVLLFLYTLPVSWARVLIICSALGSSLQILNNLYKRRGAWEKLGERDVALITGGTNGLGLEISKLLLKKKVQVIILDIEPIACTKIESQVTYYKCDLSEEAEIRRTTKKISSKFGSVTILINNAGIRQSELLTDLSLPRVNKIFNINTIAPIVLLKEFLEIRSKRLYVVTIASVLGIVSPSHLSIYSASKAALISLHDSISHEVTDSSVRFLLVTPGQLNTRMFQDVKPPKQYLAPIVDSRKLASRIVEKIELGDRGTLHGPAYTYLVPLLRLLPYSLNEFARWFSEMDTSVENP